MAKASVTMTITVIQTSDLDPLTFEVEISDASGKSHHKVVASRKDLERLAGADTVPLPCIEAAFRFLLDREPKEAILTRFDLSVIARYFPEFEVKFSCYLKAGGKGG